VQPGEFIPFAEQTGFMRVITRWVVAEGARFAHRLHQAGLHVRVSLNVTALDIQQPGFADEVGGAIARAGVKPGQICLEITESGVVSEAETALATLRAVARQGVILSVDDFGTGYATLKQLQQLPVHELKIDRSFVTGMTQNRGSEPIVRATVDMAKQLGLRVVAEGVETFAEMRALAALGCDEAQGYYIAKPMAERDVLGWIDMRHALATSSKEQYFNMLAEPSRAAPSVTTGSAAAKPVQAAGAAAPIRI
jgi:EAL domain-containing protein (putative c-di-GMP-specific phosphodiesterase class I)